MIVCCDLNISINHNVEFVHFTQSIRLKHDYLAYRHCNSQAYKVIVVRFNDSVHCQQFCDSILCVAPHVHTPSSTHTSLSLLPSAPLNLSRSYLLRIHLLCVVSITSFLYIAKVRELTV